MSKSRERERILVVDDEQIICDMMIETLELENFQSLATTNPRKALAYCEHGSFDLAFVDINMPEMSGIEFASLLKALNPSCEIVFMTGYATIENTIEAIKLGAYDYLRKPFSISEVSFCLSRFRERRILKERISQAELRYFHLVQNIPLMIFVLRRDFQVNFVNEACSSMLGYASEEVLNVPNWFFSRVYSEDRERLRTLFKTAFASGGTAFSIECRLLHKRDHLVHTIVKSIGRPAGKTEAEGDYLEGIIVDITDRVFLEKAVVQKEKLKTLGAVAAEVAHEIRNPLVSLGGFARRLQKKAPESTEVGIILRECQRLEKILDRIKNYLSPVQISSQECCIDSILKYCVDLLSPEIKARGVDCRIELTSEMQPIFADPDVLSQIFINLIRNALAAMKKGGSLMIKIFESDRALHIDFENELDGKGIGKPELLFLPFDEGGESIGLPLCYRLLKNMGGLLSFVERQQRAVFTISLPKTAID